MSKHTGYYYSNRMGVGMLVAHHYTEPIVRGRLNVPACGDDEAQELGRDLRAESEQSVRCVECEDALSDRQRDAEKESEE